MRAVGSRDRKDGSYGSHAASYGARQELEGWMIPVLHWQTAQMRFSSGWAQPHHATPGTDLSKVHHQMTACVEVLQRA